MDIELLNVKQLKLANVFCIIYYIWQLESPFRANVASSNHRLQQ